jgi:hypothetical protein
MQPKPALLLAACGALIGALAVAPATAATMPAAAGSGCHAGPGLKVNRWIGQQSAGQTGLWNNDANWSLGRYPRAGSTHQVVCLRTAARVVMWKGAQLRVHVAAIDLDGTLEVHPSNSLFVEADPDRAVSTVTPGSLLDVQGAVIGGHGRIEVRGELALSAVDGGTNVVTTRECARSCKHRPHGGRHGTVSVEGDGLFRVDGVPARVTDSYHVVLGSGQMLVQGDRGQVTADGGTRLALRGDAALTFRNNGGWYAGPVRFRGIGPTRVRIHGGVVEKVGGSGTSSIQGKVSATAGVNAQILSGQLAIAGFDDPRDITAVVASQSSYSTGSCAPASTTYACQPIATDADTQIASVTLPKASSDIRVKIKEKAATTLPTPLGLATDITGKDPEGRRALRLHRDVDRADPVVLELRYDASVVGPYTPASAVAVAQKTTYRDLPDCDAVSGRIPTTATGCVDRRPDQSRFAPDGDLVMVVRTLHFSRYVCH